MHEGLCWEIWEWLVGERGPIRVEGSRDVYGDNEGNLKFAYARLRVGGLVSQWLRPTTPSKKCDMS